MKAFFIRLCLMLTICLLMSPQQGYATHIYGASIYYSCQSACIKTVFVETHYDCYAVATPLPPASPPLPNVIFTGSGGGCAQPAPVGAWVLDSYLDVTPICPTDSTTCTSSRAVIAGTIVSIYRRDYNFCVPGICNNYVMSWSTCCRGSNLSAGGNSSLYVQTDIDLSTSPCNNSPVFAYPPLSYVCSGTGATFSQGAFDADGDSLVYSLVACQSGAGLPISYPIGFSATNPFGPSWQVSIDSRTGSLSILPNPGAMLVTPVCVQVAEYRNGGLLGSIRRDMLVIALNCGATTNAIPQVDSVSLIKGGNELAASKYVMSLGDSLQISLEVSDADAAQSLDLRLPLNIDEVSKTVIGNNPASIIFQFKPQREGLFHIPLQIEDNNCPLISSTLAEIEVEVIGIAVPPVQDSLVSGDVVAKVWSDGSLFWDPVDNEGLVIPKFTQLSSAKAGGLWIGGRDATGQLRLSAHGQDKLDRAVSDFWAGPLTQGTAETDSATVASYNKIWKISRTEIDAFLADFGDNGIVDFPANYPNIYSWPAFGNDSGGNNVTATTATGQQIFLAPFNDLNGNALDYNPNQGDHPAIKGDWMIWWIYNDKSPTHDLTAGSIGLEVHASAFAFDCPDSLDKDNTLFFEYTLINRSNTTINDTYLGFWTDGELGDPLDDYTAVDTLNDIHYFYNGGANDSRYGTNAPALGVGLLAGPLADTNDGLDNDRDGMVDEAGETWRMDGFMSLGKGNGVYNGQPTEAAHYDRYLRSFWQDSVALVADNGTGYSALPGSIRSRTMFHGNVCADLDWTEKNAGIAPGDRQTVGSMGPFTLSPGAVQRVNMHYSWTREFSQGNIGSVCELITTQRRMQQYHQSGYENCGYYEPPVHPGDANFDQIANNLDLLALGITFGEQGFHRINPTNQWMPQNALAWGDTLANGADYKHSDCTGDGLVDSMDVAPILANYGMTHTFSKTSAVGAPLFMIPPSATYMGGDTARLPIHWGDMGDPLIDAYGLAFSITYDSSRVEKAWVEYQSSWFATPGADLLALDKDLPNAQRIDIGLSRNDNMFRAGYGHIADLIIVMDDDLNKRVLPMRLEIENVYAINPQEEEIPVDAQGADINLETAIAPGLQTRLSLFPNPGRNKMYIDGLRPAELQAVSLYDAQGRAYSIDINEQQGLFAFNLDHLSAGFYLLEVQTASGKAIFKVIKQP